MAQEDKELLLRDLSARLPYGVKCEYREPDYGIVSVWRIDELEGVNDPDYWEPLVVCDHPYAKHSLSVIKPYLRPMSSMTEEEKREYTSLCNRQDIDTPTWSKVIWHDTYKSFDWLNAHHFDYRGLIERGLALEAPKGMYV